MAELEKQFQEAIITIKNLSNISHENLLKLYGLYKQSLIGDNTNSKPSIFNVQGLAKWKAWNVNIGMSKDKAKQLYIALVNDIVKCNKSL